MQRIFSTECIYIVFHKKTTRYSIATSPNVDRFSLTIRLSSKRIMKQFKVPTAPQMYRYTTL